jgi:hypothetical protein
VRELQSGADQSFRREIDQAAQHAQRAGYSKPRQRTCPQDGYSGIS